MPIEAFLLALTAAVLHATWNAIVKVGADRALVLGIIAGTHTVVGALMLAAAGLPAAAALPYVVASTLIHYVYYGGLFQSYKLGDLSQVYPLARGMAPVLVALGGWWLAGEALDTRGWFAIVLASIGISAIAFLQKGALWTDRPTLAFTVLTGLCIASYSVCDGLGVRVSENPVGYMGALFLGEAPVLPFVLRRRGWRLTSLTRSGLTKSVAGGALSCVAYSLVIYACSFAPLGAVSAVRESSVIIAAMIGTFALGEQPWQQRVGAAILVGVGVGMLALGHPA